MSLAKYVWCLIFHRHYWKRTGERRIYRVTIVYDMRCERCGNDAIEDVQYVGLDL